MVGDGVFDKATAFRNLVKELLSKFKNIRVVRDNDNLETDIKTDAEFKDESKGFSAFFEGEIGKKENNQNKFMMVIKVRPQQDTTYDHIKSAMVPFLKKANAWMTLHVFTSLDLTSIGFLSLRHASWTHIPSLRDQIESAILEIGGETEEMQLPADQKVSLQDWENDFTTIPAFELTPQRIRAYVPKSLKDTEKIKQVQFVEIKNNNGAKMKLRFAETEALEFKCEKKHAPFFNTILALISMQDLWVMGRFIPYTLRKASSIHFFSAVLEQAKHTVDCRSIMYHNVNPDIVLEIIDLANLLETIERPFFPKKELEGTYMDEEQEEQPEMNMVNYYLNFKGQLKDPKEIPLIYSMEHT